MASTLVRYTSGRVYFRARDRTSTLIDFTVSGRSLLLRITAQGGSSPIITKTTLTSANVVWVSQSGGTGYFVLSKSDKTSLALNTQYVLEIYYEDSVADTRDRVYGPSPYTAENPATGTF